MRPPRTPGKVKSVFSGELTRRGRGNVVIYIALTWTQSSVQMHGLGVAASIYHQDQQVTPTCQITMSRLYSLMFYTRGGKLQSSRTCQRLKLPTPVPHRQRRSDWTHCQAAKVVITSCQRELRCLQAPPLQYQSFHMSLCACYWQQCWQQSRQGVFHRAINKWPNKRTSPQLSSCGT